MRSLLIFLALSSALAADDLTVLDPATKPAEAFENWLISEFNKLCDKRSAAFEVMLKSEAACKTWQRERRAFFLERIGGLPERTPLNPQITGALPGKGDRVEKIIFEILTAYLMGKSYVGMRCDDVRSWTRFLKTKSSAVSVIASGEAAIPALHAAALERDAFTKITLRRMIASYESLVGADETFDQTVSMIHGVLRHYDLPDLIQLIGPDRVLIEEPLNGMGQPAASK